MNKASKTEVKNFRAHNSEGLCKLAEMLGYGDRYGQLQCNNGAYVTSLLDFFDDNPGAIEAVQEFVNDNLDCYQLEEDEEGEEEDEEDTEESEPHSQV